MLEFNRGDKMGLELYEKYRDENGYIDLNLAENDGLFNAFDIRQEFRGSDRGVGLDDAKRGSALKGWFDFSTSNDSEKSTFLVRANMFRGDETNYTDYAELIFEEFAKSLGIRSPHYDLFKYNGEHGVLSEKMINKKESMTAFDSNLKNNCQTGVKIDFVDDLIDRTLRFQGKSANDIEKIKEDLRKIIILDTVTLNEDRHLGNISFISNSETGEITLGIYDNEISLLLSTPNSQLQTPYDIKTYAKLSTNVISGNDPISYSPVDTVAEIMDEIDIDDEENHSELPAFLCKSAQLDLNDIFSKIEQRIHASIPQEVKMIVKYAYKEKVHELDEALYLKGYPEWEQSNENIGGMDR